MDSPARIPHSQILLAHVGPRGRTPADLRRVALRLGFCDEAYDAALTALRAGQRPLLVLRDGRFMRPEFTKPISDKSLGPETPKPAKPKPLSKRVRERLAKEARAAKRQELHEYWAGLIKRWLAGEAVVGEDMRRARKWWTKLGRPQL